MTAVEDTKKVIPRVLDRKSVSMYEGNGKERNMFEVTPSMNNINERHPYLISNIYCLNGNFNSSRNLRRMSTKSIDDLYERTDNNVRNVERSSLSLYKNISPSSVTPMSLFNLANNQGTFSQSLVTKNGFAIGNYYRYWQNLFDLRPCPSIFSITVTYEILGKDAARNFLLKNFEEKFIWLHDSFPLGFMYTKCHGPLSPPSTVEMMFAFGEKSWTNGNGEYLIQYTRNAKVYMKELNLVTSDDLDDLPPLDMDVLIETISDIIIY